MRGPNVLRCPHCKTRIDVSRMALNASATCRCGGTSQLVWRPSLGRAGLVKRARETAKQEASGR